MCKKINIEISIDKWNFLLNEHSHFHNFFFKFLQIITCPTDFMTPWESFSDELTAVVFEQFITLINILFDFISHKQSKQQPKEL